MIQPKAGRVVAEFSRYHDTSQALPTNGARCRYEATVGAACPHSNHAAVDTGHEVQSVDEVFSELSGCLAATMASLPFSPMVMQARELGLYRAWTRPMN